MNLPETFRLTGKKSPGITRLLLSLLLLAVVAVLAGCGGESSAETTAATDTGSKPVTINKGTVNKEDVEKMIVRKVGTVDYAGNPIVRKVELQPEAGGNAVIIQVGRPPSCHPGQVVGYITEMSRGFMSSLFLYDDVTRGDVSLYGTTENYSDSDKLAARAMMTRADAQKISDWFTFDENSIGSMCTEYWVEPAIYENWKKYGSAAITDPALLQQANQ